MAGPKISFTYKNHRGETARRHVIVDAIEYNANPGYGYAPGWFVSGQCLEKGQRRSFAFENIDPTSLHSTARHIFRLITFK